MKQLFIALFLMFFVSFANADHIDDIKSLSHDLAICSAFYSIMSDAANASAATTPDVDLSTQYSFMANMFYQAGVLSSSWAMQATQLFVSSNDEVVKYVLNKMKKAFTVITEEIKENSPLDQYGRHMIDPSTNETIQKYGNSCRELLEDPEINEFFATEKTSL